ncbi:FUSC family protein [Rhodobacteraceae bacterium NNCM2]|nr:FUSC family protein [Coraliihabitans acroporae]
MTKAAESPWPEIARQAWADLQPFPGRLGLTWRVSLLCALVAAVAMTFQIPEAAISCYLVIFLMKQDATQNCLMGFGLILLATTVVAIMIPIIDFSIDSPAMRLTIIFFATYVFLFLSSTTPLGEQAAIVGLIIAFIMTLVTDVPVGQIGDQGLLMAWKMACMPMMLMVLLNLLLGVPAQTHVRNKIVERLRRAADQVLVAGRADKTAELLGEGNDQQLQQIMVVKLLHLVPSAHSKWLSGAIETSYRALMAAVALPEGTSQADRAAMASRLRAAADAAADGAIPKPPTDLPASANPAEATLCDALSGLSRLDGGGAPTLRKIPMLAPDWYSNPDHQRYALKTSVAAVVCYLVYTGLQWDGIHTAMITCYVAALGTTGETVRKLTLRIVGCLVGAALGAASLIFVMPHLTSVGGLMALVFCGVFVGAWVSSGSERISYAGVQVALAFLLTTLNGFGPSFEFSQASDRIYGILLGIFVIYLIFTQFWPRSVVGAVRRHYASALDALEQLSTLPNEDTRARTEAETAAQIEMAQAGELLEMAPFEPARLRSSPEQLRRIQDAIEEARDLASQIFFREIDEAAVSHRLREMRARVADDDHREDAGPRSQGTPHLALPAG